MKKSKSKKKIVIKDLTTGLYYVGAVGDKKSAPERLYFSTIYEAEYFDSFAAAERRMDEEFDLFTNEKEGLIVAQLVEVYNFQPEPAAAVAAAA